MNFIAPGAFILGLLLPVIVAFYLLKLRRVEQAVPSVYLWRRMVRDVEANAPWQRLRFNLLMILQLLFLAALIFALARPFNWSTGGSGQAAIFILDTSASMSATDVAPNRLESAMQRARQLVDDLPDSARVTILSAGKEAQVMVSSSLDRRQAHQAIDSIRPETGGSDMTTALELSSAIATRQPGTDIFVLSDGRVTLPAKMTLKGRLIYLPFGLSGNNQAISLLNLTPAAGGNSLTAFVQVSNYDTQPVSRRLLLYADEQLINAFDLKDIPAGGQQATLAEGISPQVRTIEARFDTIDSFPLDDRAIAVKPQSQTLPVTLVGGSNVFLKAALSLLPGVVLNQVELDGALEPTPQANQPTATPAPTPTLQTRPASTASITIYDNNVPATIPAQGSLLFIAPPRSTELFTTTGIVQAPTPRALDPNDPLLDHVTLSNISVLDAVDIPLPDWALPVIGGDLAGGQSVPLLFRGEINGRRVAVLAFDLHHSDLPLNVAFPLLWSNLIDWLAPGARNPVPVLVNPGESLAFTAPAGSSAQEAAVTRPDGSVVKVEADQGKFIFADTSQLGLYQVDFGNNTKADFASNLFSPQESDIKPADSLAGVSSLSGPSGSTQQGQREWWRYLALLALGLLVGEWLVYQRAGVARLRDAVLTIVRPAMQRAGDRRRLPYKGRK